MDRPSTCSASPAKKYSVRFVPGRAGGTAHAAPGESRIVQMATSESSRDAQERGGGAGGDASPNRPAIVVTSTARPSASFRETVGISSDHSIV